MSEQSLRHATDSDEPSRAGEVLRGKYRLDELVGAGGMGCVYRALHLLTGRDVAVKLVRARYTHDPNVALHFLHEARAATMVRHPHVVDVLDADLDRTGAPFLVMEYLQGESLSQCVHRRGGLLPVHDAVELLLPAVDAVAHAHARGVVHRDLKPCNVFLSRTEFGVVPKVLDFGISKITPTGESGEDRGEGDEGDEGANSDAVMGTPGYMSPEQMIGGAEITPATDVWSLGVMLQEVISGASPFGPTPDTTHGLLQCFRSPVPLDEAVPGAPVDLARIVDRCLRRDPRDRYPSAAELARDLRNFHWEFPAEPAAAPVRAPAPAPRPGRAEAPSPVNDVSVTLPRAGRVA